MLSLRKIWKRLRRKMMNEFERQLAAEKAVDALSREVNSFSNGWDDLGTAFANIHPTLLGQIAKAVAVGVMRRTVRDPEWKPFDRVKDAMLCDEGQTSFRFGTEATLVSMPAHAVHDGRLNCTTVIGAELMARQSFI